MDNTFNVNDYFTENYGLPAKPKVTPINKKTIAIGVVLCLTLFGLIIGLPIIIVTCVKHSSEKSKADEWQRNYNERRKKWDAELDGFYNKTVESMDLREKAIDKLGLDESNFTRETDGTKIEPFCIHGQTYDGWYRVGADGEIRTDGREITWIFFTEDQVLLYIISFSLTGRDRKVENTQEFFYTDIVSVSTGTISKTLNAKKSAGGKVETAFAEELRLIVPGDKISLAFTATTTSSDAVRKMKGWIRDKKIGNDKKKKDNADDND